MDSSPGCTRCCLEMPEGLSAIIRGAYDSTADNWGGQAGAGVSSQHDVISKERLDDWLDDALADTFPASDPVASPPSGAAPVEGDRSASNQSVGWPRRHRNVRVVKACRCPSTSKSPVFC